MKTTIAIITALALLLGCSTTTSTKTQTPIEIRLERAGIKVIIDLDALTDSDDFGALHTALALMKNGELNILAIMTSGKDATGRRELAIRAVLEYWGYGDIPIGTNVRAGQRESFTRSAILNPKLNYAYAGDKKDISEFKNNTTPTVDAIQLYCDILSATTEKVSIPVLGNQYNIKDLIIETEKCNGLELVKTKVQDIILVGGMPTSYWDMNFGAHKPFHQYTAGVSRFVNQMTPKETRLVLMDNAAGYNLKVGSAFLEYNIQSPQAFMYAGQSNYLTEGAQAWDTAAVVFAARGAKYWNTQAGEIILDNDARVSWNANSTKNHLKLFPKYSTGFMTEIMESFIRMEP